MNKPHRAHRLEINMEGDTESDVIDGLRDLLFYFEAERGGKLSEPCLGGLHGGYWCKYTHNPDMTHDKYFEGIKEWKDARSNETKNKST